MMNESAMHCIAVLGVAPSIQDMQVPNFIYIGHGRERRISTLALEERLVAFSG